LHISIRSGTITVPSSEVLKNLEDYAVGKIRRGELTVKLFKIKEFIPVDSHIPHM
jgi:hypothetical protein